MPIYEFTCAKGHVSEDLVSIGTKSVICQPCIAEEKATGRVTKHPKVATRILSPTRTTFEFADNRKHKDWDKTP